MLAILSETGEGGFPFTSPFKKKNPYTRSEQSVTYLPLSNQENFAQKYVPDGKKASQVQLKSHDFGGFFSIFCLLPTKIY